MNNRIKQLVEAVLKVGNKKELTWCKDEEIGKMLANAEDAKKLAVIREEYAKIIPTDTNIKLAGSSPMINFWERKKFPGTEAAYRELFAKYRDLEMKRFVYGGEHKTMNVEYVLHHGIEGLKKRILDTKATITDEEKLEYLDDLYYVCEAVISWSNAHGDACVLAAKKAESDKRREELLEIARICRKVPQYPAESFREAVQSYQFMFILFPDGLGRIDQYLYPFYRQDTDKGLLDDEQALDLIEELFVMIFSQEKHWYNESSANHGVVAGYLPNGECGHNECSSLVLRAVTDLPLWRPQISYRVTAKTTMEQLREALEANVKRQDTVMFLNDDVIVENWLRLGVSYEDAVGYSPSGCNETLLTGCSQVGAVEGFYNSMYTLEQMLKDTASLKDICDFEEFYKRFEERLEKDMELIKAISHDKDAATATDPDLIRSVFTEGCIESATPLSKGGAKYNFCSWMLIGLVNLADSLNVIRQMVFEEKRFRLEELSRFLQANWEGYEKERSYIRNNTRFFGNDDDEADDMINRIAASMNEISRDWVSYRKGRFLYGSLAGGENTHIDLGKATGATPDGRYAGDPFTAGITACPGADKRGMTAYLKSAAKVKGEYLPTSIVVNLKLDRTLADTEEKRDRLAAMFMAYFRMGGVHLQVNYLSAEELLKAQKEPDKYSNLRVRVTGYSGFFTTFDKALQEEVISRSLHTN